jgi:GH15 family glucan-1,4-alpha-glucosidase
LQTAASSGDFSVDWLCWPRFDPPACFASLVGTTDNGRWSIAPAIQREVTRVSRPHGDSRNHDRDGRGVAIVTDFMPVNVHGYILSAWCAA